MKRFALTALFILAVSCAPKIRQYDYETFAMDTLVHATLYDSKPKDLIDEAVSDAFRQTTDMEQKYSAFAADSVVYRLNASGSADIDAETYAVLSNALHYGEMTGGLFDVTVFPLMKLWGFATKDYRAPSQFEIDRTRAQVGYRSVILDPGRVRLTGGSQIDLGGILKGYAVDRMVAILTNAGVEGGLINAGGNIRAFGVKPDGNGWKIGIRDPRRPGEVFAAYVIDGDFSIATSGDYERYFIRDGIRYHHIMSPFEGAPCRNGVISASVIVPLAMDADALSTSLFLMGVNNGIAFAESNRLPVLLLYESNGKILSTNSAFWDFKAIPLN